jgi:hypothetical protein
MNGCIDEGVDVSCDIGTSLMIHQLASIMRYPTYEAMLEAREEARCQSLTSTDLLRIVVQALDRCKAIRESEMRHLGTEALYQDRELCDLVSALYVGTLAEDFDHYSGNTYGNAYAAAQRAYKETHHANTR